jgi:hypothetical protein
MMEYDLVLQTQVLYLQLHNQFVSLVHDFLVHELILLKNKNKRNLIKEKNILFKCVIDAGKIKDILGR